MARLHDVGTGIDPRETMDSEFDTPSLLGIYDTAPYLHDGSAATLRAVLTTRNAGDKHGDTSTLTEEQVDALVALPQIAPVAPRRQSEASGRSAPPPGRRRARGRPAQG